MLLFKFLRRSDREPQGPKPEQGVPTKSQKNININQMDVRQLQHPIGYIVAVLTQATKAIPRELAPFRAKGCCGSWPPWAPLEQPVSTAS